MATVMFSRYSNFHSYTRNLISVLTFLLVSQSFCPQETPQSRPGKRKIEVLHSSEGIDEIEKSTGKRLTRLIGDVSLKHNDIFMTCDSAHFYTGYNQIKAYSRIHMEQGDTLQLRGDSIFYDGQTEMATVDGNVELIDNETHLFTNSVKYDVANKIATYND